MDMQDRPHDRRSIRLRGYDYSLPGAYFVTICVHGKAQLLGEVANGAMRRTPAGDIAHEEWEKLPLYFPGMFLDQRIIMPNHLHGIIAINSGGIQAPAGAQGAASGAIRGAASGAIRGAASGAPTLGRMIRAFKSSSAHRINRLLGRTGQVWQRNYYEHIIRGPKPLEKIRRYIHDNPANWMVDRDNPSAVECEEKNAWMM